MTLALVRANLAVISIFRGQRVPAFGRLEMSELRSQWPRYALRQRDLDRSIERLESLGWVEIDRTRRGLKFVVLTPTGYRSAHSWIGWLESVITWPRRLLRAAWSWRTRRARPDPRRRHTDPPHGAGSS